MPAPSKLQRWLDLIAFLSTRTFPVSVEDIMERVPAYAAKWETGDEKARAAARRAFERDKDELRRVGIPIRTVPYRVGYGLERMEGYQLPRQDFYLPYLRLVTGAGAGGASGGRERLAGRLPSRPRGVGEVEIREDEAGLALDALRRVADLPGFPLRREARSAFRKLAFDLDPERFGATPVIHVSDAKTEPGPEVVRLLFRALLDRKRVRFSYHGIYRGEETERDVAPYGLLFQGGHWYLVGHDALRDGVRVFRVSRMDGVRPETRSPRTPDYEIPDDFRLSDLAERDAWELGGPEEAPVEARVRFRFPRSLWADRNGYGRLEDEGGDGSAVRRFAVRQVGPFLRWILTLEGDAEVLAPPELRQAVRELAERTAARYGSPEGDA